MDKNEILNAQIRLCAPSARRFPQSLRSLGRTWLGCQHFVMLNESEASPREACSLQRHCEEGITRRGNLLRLYWEIPTVAALPRNDAV